ncbi:FAD-dependent oxidoreductase [Pseudorhodobacter sp. E13]|uniref:NAD(P)/FAD-dependent oxidoreductase n=1 Tax=Pseudorhodobacter sp. E13 TaxID=2487931 RepID=UPI000F8E10FA|nr:FAD-dependent oxidoreductase [Pseudorhodobacter sp. E13]RUS60128.1 FAD-dependent oxidoreductase [Pseudorhodobacter sp. E13]
MPLETTAAATRRIAVIGGGISGMAAAHLLSRDHQVVLFEAEKRLGGHARTVLAGKRGDQPVDTGFIVFNHVNYPNLVGLFEKLGVPTAKSDMSFGASIGGGRFEYGFRDWAGLVAQKSNIVNPRYWGMLRDIMRFNARAEELAGDGSMTIRDLLAALGAGDWFRDYYLLPLSGAIWSTPTQGILDFPARAMIDFFKNHALLGVTGQHQWYTVQGGSIEYVRRVQAALETAGVDLRLGAPVAGVRRAAGQVFVRGTGAEWEAFDEVIFATHSDDTLRLLEDPTAFETAQLGAIRYQPNDVVLHSDAAMMPKRRAAWASWVYVEGAGPRPDRIDLTYWMNSLQPIPMDDPLFVTLNANKPIREALIHDQVTFRHPVYDLGALEAQRAIRASNGSNGTWFCGAWMRNGFHEDGFASAVDVVDALRARQVAAAA